MKKQQNQNKQKSNLSSAKKQKSSIKKSEEKLELKNENLKPADEKLKAEPIKQKTEKKEKIKPQKAANFSNKKKNKNVSPMSISRFNPKAEEGLSSQQVEQRTEEGLVNISRLKTNKSLGGIFAKNIFTFFNLTCIVVAAALAFFKKLKLKRQWTNCRLPTAISQKWCEIVKKLKFIKPKLCWTMFWCLTPECKLRATAS